MVHDNACVEGNLPRDDDRKYKKKRVPLQSHGTKAVGEIGIQEEKIGRTSKADGRNVV